MKLLNWSKTYRSEHKGNESEKSGFDWSELTDKDYSSQSRHITSWLRSSSGASSNRTHLFRRFFSMNVFKTRYIRLAWMSIIIIVGIIACNIPVKYTETVGNVLSWSVIDSSGTAEDQVNALYWIPGTDLSVRLEMVNELPMKTFQAILKTTSDDELDALIADITSLDGYQNYQLTAIDDQRTVPMYRAVLHTFININIDVSDMNDDEMIAAIQDQLIMQGLNPTHITVSHPTPESIEFGFEFDTQSEPGVEKEIHMQIMNEEAGGIGSVQANMLHLDPSETEGKTADEIRELILQKYQESGLDLPDNLEVNNENGEMQITIQSEDCD